MSAYRYKITTHVFPGQHIRQYPGANRNKDEDVQYLEATQYTPLNNTEPREGDVTIIGAGAVYEGFEKLGFARYESVGYPEPGKVTLRTTKANEAWTYVRSWFDPLPSDDNYISERGRIKYPDGDESIFDTYPFYCPETCYVWDALPQIRVSVFYIFPDSSPMSTEDLRVKKVEQTGSGNCGSGGENAGMTSKIVINGCGHLVAFEKPGECAETAVEWLARSLKTWEERRKYEKENRDNKSIHQVAMSDEWNKRAKEGFDAFMARSKSKL